MRVVVSKDESGAAFAAAAVSAVTGSAWAGLGAGIATAVALALLIARAAVDKALQRLVTSGGEPLIRQDLDRGIGFAVLDPHGDLIDRILGIIPESRIHYVHHWFCREPYIGQYIWESGVHS